MNTILRGILVVSTLFLVLGGCGTSPASNYYLLSAKTSGQPSGIKPSLGVGPIEIPEYLNRNAFIYNRDGNKLHIENFERWAEPLDSGIERVLRLNLASLLNSEDVQAFPWSRSDQPEYGVKVSVLNLDANDRSASLIAEWHLHRPQGNETIVRRLSELHHSLPPGPIVAADIAPAYSELLQQLSELIAAAILEDYAQRKTEGANRD